ncbi:MAG: DoxX family protein [Bacteroidota bacterium]
MKILTVIGRILFALPFGIIGLNHFFMTDFFLGMMSSFIPSGGYTILLTGVFLIAASISIMLNKFIRITCFCLAGLLLIFIATIHIPGLFTANAELALVELLKDTSLMGGALMIAGFYGAPKVESTKE